MFMRAAVMMHTVCLQRHETFDGSFPHNCLTGPVNEEFLQRSVQGCYACTPTIKVPDNREVRDNKRRDFRCSKSAMHEPDVGPGERSIRLPARSL